MDNKSYGLFYFKLGCLLFWACWFSMAFLTNITDAMFVAGWLPNEWIFKSANYGLLERTISIYHPPHWFMNFLFTCDVIVQGISAALFFCAFMIFWRTGSAWRFINSAFTLSIALWGVFIIMEEIFIAYAFETGHVTLFVFEMLTLMMMHLLPHRTRD